MENKKEEAEVVPETKSFRCASGTDPIALAKSLAYSTRQGHKIHIQALGNQAVGQAVKAVTILNSYTASKAKLWCILPSMDDVPMEDNTTGAVRPITVTTLRLLAVQL